MGQPVQLFDANGQPISSAAPLPVSLLGSNATAEVLVGDQVVVAAGATFNSAIVDLSKMNGVAAAARIFEASTTASSLEIRARATDGASDREFVLGSVSLPTSAGGSATDVRLRIASKVFLQIRNLDNVQHTYSVWRRDFLLY